MSKQTNDAKARLTVAEAEERAAWHGLQRAQASVDESRRRAATCRNALEHEQALDRHQLADALRPGSMPPLVDVPVWGAQTKPYLWLIARYRGNKLVTYAVQVEDGPFKTRIMVKTAADGHELLKTLERLSQAVIITVNTQAGEEPNDPTDRR